MRYFIPDIAISAGGFVIDSLVIGQGTNIPAAVNFVITGGYTDPGDGGGARYKRVAVAPAHDAYFESADGAFWEIAETVINPRMLGAVGDGVADDTAAIQSAVDLGLEVCFDAGVYLTTAPITISTTGQKITGSTFQDALIRSGAHDGFRVEGAFVFISFLHFRPSAASNASPPAFACIRIYGPRCTVANCRFLSEPDGDGTAILFDDENPVGPVTVAGAYAHTITNNDFGADTYAFRVPLYFYSAVNGQQANQVSNNKFLSDAPIYVLQGGGNFYRGNLFQSYTGTAGVPAGAAIDLQADVIGEVIEGNYFERYIYGTIMRRAVDDRALALIPANHYDNVTNPLYTTGSLRYRGFDEVSFIEYNNGWQINYGAQTDFYVTTPGGVVVETIHNAENAVEQRISANSFAQLGFTADAQTQTPTHSFMNITGAGAARVNCELGDGVIDGQHLYLYGLTWSVQILNTNIVFDGSVASVIFGGAATNIASMHLVWSEGLGSWIEVSRTIV